MINFNHLRVFYHVAKHLSFTLAARDLCITQPAVTKQVKSLEDLWDLKLFDKKGGRIFLTEEGRALFEYAKKVFEYEKEIETAVEDIRQLKRGVLRIATPKPLMSLMSFLMDIYHKEFPDIRIQVNEGSSLSLIHSLLNYQTEIAIISKIEDQSNIWFVHFSHEEIFFVVGPNHRLEKAHSVSLSELSREPIILREAGSGSRKVVLDLFERNNHTPNILLETNNTEFTKQHLQRGEAAAFMAEAWISDEIQDGKFVRVPIRDHQIFLEIYVAFLRDRPLSLPAKAFLKVLVEITPRSKHFPYLVPSWPNNCPSLEEV